MTSAIFLPLSPASNFPFLTCLPRPTVSVVSYAAAAAAALLAALSDIQRADIDRRLFCCTRRSERNVDRIVSGKSSLCLPTEHRIASIRSCSVCRSNSNGEGVFSYFGRLERVFLHILNFLFRNLEFFWTRVYFDTRKRTANCQLK